MRTHAARIAIFVVATLLTVACEGEVFGGVRGSGDLITESRPVSGFDEIVVEGSGNVVVDVTGSESLEIAAEDNIMPLLTSEVEGGRLVLGIESGERISPRREITYTITAEMLRGVSILGSGDVTASEIDADAFEARISGSGNIEPEGTCDHLEVTISGSGRYRGADLVAGTGDVRVSGSGDVLVNVTDDLTVSISGSGDVAYMGDPRVDQSISGSGDVSRR